MTKSQIDKLGELLRSGRRDEEVLRMLEALYGAYEPAAQEIHAIVANVIGELNFIEEPEFTQRATKSLVSIVAKLDREKTRLSSMQDVIGCRVVVGDRADQRTVLSSLTLPEGFMATAEEIYAPETVPPEVLSRPFRNAVTIDRNASPRSGYRAIHVVVRDIGPPYEIQLRTRLQDRWAQLSEFCDSVFPGIKYGGGPPDLRERLFALSDLTDAVESKGDEPEELEQLYPDMDHEFVNRRRDRIEAELSELHRMYDAFREAVEGYRS